MFDSLPSTIRAKEACTVIRNSLKETYQNQFKEDITSECIVEDIQAHWHQGNGFDCGPFVVFFVWNYFNELGFKSSIALTTVNEKIGEDVRAFMIKQQQIIR